jgi:hypothetical protein
MRGVFACDVTGLRRGVTATGLIGFGDETCDVVDDDGDDDDVRSCPLMMESMLKLDILWPLF